jgi:S-adenosylmethionine-diacylgycerolhomoserine-N-methlytransferase
MDHAETVDRIYRHQRHLYDVTRRFFLLGRNALMDTMDVSAGEAVLEVGCGTGRNLIRLARRCPDARLFGIDASNQMLRTARTNIARARLGRPIEMAHCLAEALNPQVVFGASLLFDKIFFSYSLSMMPSWQAALEAAFAHLAESGSVHVVDFWDQKGWPSPLKRAFRRWLALFEVRYHPEMIPCLARYFADRSQRIALTDIARRYAFLASPGSEATK